MKKLFSLVSLLTCLGFGGLLASASPVNMPGVEKAGEETFIVTIDQGVKSSKADVARNKVLNELAYRLPEELYHIDHVYDEVLNGFSITMDSSLKDYVAEIPGVASVEVSHTYARPTASTLSSGASTFASSAEDIKRDKLANYSAETMSATSTDISKAIKDVTGTEGEAQLGKGITIGIIDTGLFLNQVEGTSQRSELEATADEYNAAAFKDTTNVEDVLSESVVNAAKSDPEFVGQEGVRINKKIAFAYDYQGNDDNVNPSTADHGTHVASLAAANGDDFTGIAPNAQLAILKVFPDGDGGAGDSDIIAAINDAAKLGLDVINLSLGTDLTDYDDDASSLTYQAIQGAIEAGVIVNYAAGNSGKSSFSGNQGYSDWTTDTVESSYLGGETLNDENVNIVASSNPDKAFYESILLVNGTAVSYYDQVINREGSTIEYNQEHPFTQLLGDQQEGTFNYVRIGGVGANSDYQSFYDSYNQEHETEITSFAGLKEQLGKDSKVIAVIDRGETTFTEKTLAAQAAGADALIVINNDASVTFNFNFDYGSYNPEIPVILVFQNMGPTFGEDNTVGELTLSTNQAVVAPDGNITSSFSSDGPSYNLDISPTISAPGGQVIGAIDASVVGATSKLAGYDNMSGTSMASPNFSGALASVLSEKKPENGGSLALEDDEAFAAYKKKISNIAMSTANQLVDSTANNIGSIRLQGSGIINVADMLGNNAYVTSPSVSDSEAVSSSEALKTESTEVSKVELKNRGTLNTDLATDEEAYIEFSYTIHNDSSKTRTYTPSLSLMIPDLRIQLTTSEYENSKENDPTTVADVAENLPGSITTSINDQTLTIPDANWAEGKGDVEVAANSTATGKVRVRIDNIELDKVFDADVDGDGEKDVPDFHGTLREYFNQYFKSAGGSYVEGYLYLTEKDSTTSEDNENGVSHTLTMPYLGFYGDYTVGKAVEPFQFEKEKGHLYNSELADAYIKNLSGTAAKRNAYTGSTLAATGSTPTSSEIGRIGDLSTSAYPNGTKYLDIARYDENGDLYLKAGANGVSDHLVSVFYVNRSVSEATWSISGSGVNKSGQIGDLYEYSSGWASATGMGLAKSLFVPGTTSYLMHHGYACIDISSLDEGEYTLSYNFTLRGTNTTQTSSYKLIIDKTVPEFISAVSQTSSTGRQQLVVTTKGGDSAISYAGRAAIPVKVEGSDDLYQATLTLTDTILEENDGRLNITITDTAYNSISVIVHLNSLNAFVSASDIPDDSDFVLSPTNISAGNYSYDVNLTDADGADLDYDGVASLTLYIGTGLDASTITASVNGQAAENMSYDSASGYLTLHGVQFTDGFASISLSRQVIAPGTTPVDPSTPSGGLQAWHIALIAVGGVIVVGGAAFLTIFFLKKKKAK